MTEGLVRFGYKELTANRDNLMCKAGEKIRCHEFHYSDTDCYGDGFSAEKRGRNYQTIVADDTYLPDILIYTCGATSGSRKIMLESAAPTEGKHGN